MSSASRAVAIIAKSLFAYSSCSADVTANAYIIKSRRTGAYISRGQKACSHRTSFNMLRTYQPLTVRDYYRPTHWLSKPQHTVGVIFVIVVIIVQSRRPITI